MQLQIKLSFEKNQSWKFDQSILQGIFYNLLKVSNINDKHGNHLGLFCYSNIFFEKDEFKAGNIYNLIFRSSDKQIINCIYEGLLLRKNFNFGIDNSILVKKVFVDNTDNIYSGKILQGQTPIVLSIDEELTKKYGIKYDRGGKPLYWNKEMGFDIFVKQINKNILHKYIYMINSGYIGVLNDFDKNIIDLYKDLGKFNEFAENLDFFKGYKFKRGALVNYKGGKIAGSLWNFITGENKNLLKVLKNVSEIGFGERCTAGFGFIN